VWTCDQTFERIKEQDNPIEWIEARYDTGATRPRAEKKRSRSRRERMRMRKMKRITDHRNSRIFVSIWLHFTWQEDTGEDI
jgi:hypothetical protein